MHKHIGVSTLLSKGLIEVLPFIKAYLLLFFLVSFLLFTLSLMLDAAIGDDMKIPPLTWFLRSDMRIFHVSPDLHFFYFKSKWKKIMLLKFLLASLRSQNLKIFQGSSSCGTSKHIFFLSGSAGSLIFCGRHNLHFKIQNLNSYPDI